MATVLFKVFALTLKTVAKPLASRFETAVMNHPVARQKVLQLAQTLHRLDVTLTRGAEGKTGRVFVADMTEERAVQLASKVASEGFVYAVGIALVVLELDRKRRDDDKKKLKEQAERDEIQRLHEQHLRAEKEVREQQQQMSEVLRRIEERVSRMEQQLTSARVSPVPGQ